jgi:hypothetical protein
VAAGRADARGVADADQRRMRSGFTLSA